MRIAVYPGTFDPITNGHLDILKRSAALFDKVVVGVAASFSGKVPVFSIEERTALVKEVVKDMENVEVEAFDGLLMHFVEKKGAVALIRGLRAVSDFEYEFQMALMNKKLNAQVETVFLMTSSEYAFVSSTVIKQIVGLDGKIDGFVPPAIHKALLEKFQKGGR